MLQASHADLKNDIGLALDEIIKLIYGLSSQYSMEDLNFNVVEPGEGSRPYWMQRSEFLSSHANENNRLDYSIAAHFYLKTQLMLDSHLAIEEYFFVWINSLYAARSDKATTRDILVLFLATHVDQLKHLCILDQPQYRQIEATDEVLQACFADATQCQLFNGNGFSEWILQKWLPNLLQNYFKRIRQKNLATLLNEAPVNIPIEFGDHFSIKNPLIYAH